MLNKPNGTAIFFVARETFLQNKLSTKNPEVPAESLRF